MSQDNTPSESKNKSEASFAQYPSFTIDDLLPRMREIANQYGVGGQPATRKEICTLLKKAEPTLVYFFSTCIQYGLLIPVGKGLVVTELFEKIEKPIFGEQGKRAAKMEAFNNPTIYRKLIESFNNKTLPNEEGLANLLKTKDYQVHSNTAPKAAKIFYENGRSINVIDSSNRLTYLIPNINGAEDKPLPKTPPPSGEIDDSQEEKGMVKIVVPFGKAGDGKKAYVMLPENYTNKDLKRVAKFLAALEDDEDDGQ